VRHLSDKKNQRQKKGERCKKKREIKAALKRLNKRNRKNKRQRGAKKKAAPKKKSEQKKKIRSACILFCHVLFFIQPNYMLCSYCTVSRICFYSVFLWAHRVLFLSVFLVFLTCGCIRIGFFFIFKVSPISSYLFSVLFLFSVFSRVLHLHWPFFVFLFRSVSYFFLYINKIKIKINTILWILNLSQSLINNTSTTKLLI
jgi:hypothetical protein